jgi:hypothetical protein
VGCQVLPDRSQRADLFELDIEAFRCDAHEIVVPKDMAEILIAKAMKGFK